ncbi:MAG: hypothetical protein IT317_10710 [Anaerolineales bacterium]|nr:hypothetical protein [Anaerolineales bacterium]
MTNNNELKEWPTIIRVGTLDAFLTEVAPGAVVRLIQTHHQNEAFRTLFLHVQALTASGEVAWLCEAHQIMYWNGDGPAGAQDRQIADGMAALQTQLRDFLLANGFVVRDETEFGLPEAVKPLRGRIGRWVKGQDGSLTVTPDVPVATTRPAA